MDSLLLTLSQEFFEENFSVFDRVQLWETLIDASNALNHLSHLAYEDGDLNQSLDLGRLTFEIDCLVDVISDTLKGKSNESFTFGEDIEDCSGLSDGR